MKIALVSDFETSGGAAIAALRLSIGLDRKGLDVKRFVNFKESPSERTIDCGNLKLKEYILFEFLKRFNYPKSLKYMTGVTNKKVLEQVKEFNPNIVNIHNIHSAYLSLDLVEMLLKAGFKVVWTLHDMWSFTGHCAYAYDCELFKKECDETCPRPEDYPPLEPAQITGAFRRRKTLYSKYQKNLTVVTPSKWLAAQAKKGIFFENKVLVIANGIDTEIFSPCDKRTARVALNLPREAKIILTASQDLRDKRKGWTYLEEALRHLDSHYQILLLTYGKQIDDSNQEAQNYRIVNMGTIRDERLMRLCYCAADLFVLPTLADNLPNVLLESIASGTPCVAFDVGGVSDVVRPGITGFLACYQDARDLAEQIQKVLRLELEEIKYLSQNCRKIALSEYTLDVQAQSYLDLFKEICRNS